MSAHTTHSLNANSASVRLQMEKSIDRLAVAARKGVEPASFFSEVLQSALDAGGARRAILWRRLLDGSWQIACESPSEVGRDEDFIQQRQSQLEEAAKASDPSFLGQNSGLNASHRDESTSSGSQILSPIRHSGNTVGVLETVHEVDDASRLPSDTVPFCAALCEITGDYLSHQELDQLRRAQSQWQICDQFSQLLWESLDLASVSYAIANDGRLVADCDRVSVLIRQGRHYSLKAVSGVSVIEPRASANRAMEALAELTARQGQAIWHQSSRPDEQTEETSELMQHLKRYAEDAGINGMGLIPVTENINGKEQQSPCAVLILEKFHAFAEFDAWKARGELLEARCSPVLRAAIEQSRIPWLGLWRQYRTLPELWLSPTTMIVLSVLIAIIGGLALIPAEFTLSGTAELWPAGRRDIFATSSGIVERTLVAHGDEVVKDQPLIVLRDPELESDAPRILGEIATLNERLKGVQAARFIGGNSPDTTMRARQLTVDEEELKERLQTLERQRELIEERLNQLTLSSPIAGRVLTWDVDQLLSARPVERGQTLLTIGDTAGPWIVEVRVPDKDAGHLLRARKKLKSDLDVDFLLPSEPGRTYRGRVQEVALSCDTDETAHSSLRVVVAFDRNQIEHPRAGATAIPRIHCGSRSLGYVWLRDLIDVIRTKLLF